MFGKLKKLVRKSKGMEALQAVLLVGAGFLIVWGLMALWDGAKDTAGTNVNSIVGGQSNGGAPAGGGAPAAAGRPARR